MNINQRGFTLLELLIATTIFSVILLLCTFGLIEIGKNYYKGATIARTQNVARTALDEITQAIQFGSSIPTGINITNGSGDICLGNKKFIYNTGQQVDGTTHALQVQRGCTGSGPLDELLGKNMQLWTFKISEHNSDYAVTIKVIYGDDDLIDLSTGTCKPQSGSQFCAVSELSTTVNRRVN